MLPKGTTALLAKCFIPKGARQGGKSTQQGKQEAATTHLASGEGVCGSDEGIDSNGDAGLGGAGDAGARIHHQISHLHVGHINAP